MKVEIDKVHGEFSPSYGTVANWIAEFKRGRTST